MYVKEKCCESEHQPLTVNRPGLSLHTTIGLFSFMQHFALMNKSQDVAVATDSLIVHHNLMHPQTLLCKLQADFYQNSQII